MTDVETYLERADLALQNFQQAQSWDVRRDLLDAAATWLDAAERRIARRNLGDTELVNALASARAKVAQAKAALPA